MHAIFVLGHYFNYARVIGLRTVRLDVELNMYINEVFR